jgi:hypothetical protein
MEKISERIAIIKGSEDLTVYIKASSSRDVKKITMLKWWTILWTIAGMLMLTQLFYPGNSDDIKIFVMVYMVFWGYFEYKIANAYFFRKYGTEVIYINNNKFMIRRDVHEKQGKQLYFSSKIKNPFRKVEDNKGINSAYYQSFWVITGGSIAFGEKKEEYRFGLHLTAEETETLVKLMNKTIQLPS